MGWKCWTAKKHKHKIVKSDTIAAVFIMLEVLKRESLLDGQTISNKRQWNSSMECYLA